jgi:hypothetical protein
MMCQRHGTNTRASYQCGKHGRVAVSNNDAVDRLGDSHILQHLGVKAVVTEVDAALDRPWRVHCPPIRRQTSERLTGHTCQSLVH